MVNDIRSSNKIYLYRMITSWQSFPYKHCPTLLI